MLHPEEQAYQVRADRCIPGRRKLDYVHQERQRSCLSCKPRLDPAGCLIRGQAKGRLVAYPLHREGDELVIELDPDLAG